ncbi:CBS domain-containing protein [Streptomyces tanashiensis]|uniref:CBS domain-containing protein n=1 Tax=Streptomyces tanashiensis TaxID=67367 RepID=UPI001679DBE6|nr:CBS domain-containing protein [Streptomyces tanashiensis]GGS88987.1 CBS domain-containing protein [Streptomyces tanashiensis]
MKVSEVMSLPAVAVPAGTLLGQVAQEMAGYEVGSVLVTEGGTLRGIVTDRDLAVRAVARGWDADERVDAVMTSPVITVDVTDDIHVAYRTFRRSGFRRLPVLDGHRIVGVLTVDDMLIDVFQRLADLLGPIAWSVLEEPPEPPSASTGPNGT